LTLLLVNLIRVHIFADTVFADISTLSTLHGTGGPTPAQEDIMIKHLIIAALFAIGGAGVVLVGYLASEPLAFTHPVEKLLVVGNQSVRPPAVTMPGAYATLVEVATSPVVLAEVRISPRARSTPKSALVPVRFDPCSAWRDMGPALVDPAGAGGTRTVRALCAQSDDDR
jgi:hypothetical protein